MPPVEYLSRGIVQLKSSTIYWDDANNKLLNKKTPNTITIRPSLKGEINYLSITRISRDCVGIQISDGVNTQFVFIGDNQHKTRCTINQAVRTPLEGWRAFQMELLSESNPSLNKLYKPLSGFLIQLMSQAQELRKPFKSWFKVGNEVLSFECEFSTNRDKVYHYQVLTEDGTHTAAIGVSLRPLFRKIKSIRDKRLQYESLPS